MKSTGTPSPNLDIAALVIDDDQGSLHLLHAILEAWDVVLIDAASVEEAKIMLNVIRPDIILCDIMLPGGGGLNFVRWLRHRAVVEFRTIPAIAMTSRYDLVNARTAREAGFDVFMLKPIDPDQLPHIVALLVAGRMVPDRRKQPSPTD